MVQVGDSHVTLSSDHSRAKKAWLSIKEGGRSPLPHIPFPFSLWMGSFCLWAAEHVTVDLVLLVCSMFSLTWPGKAAGAESADGLLSLSVENSSLLWDTDHEIPFFGGECIFLTPLAISISLITHVSIQCLSILWATCAKPCYEESSLCCF